MTRDYKAEVMSAFERARHLAGLSKVDFILAVRERMQDEEGRRLTRSTYYNWLDGNGGPRADALLVAAELADVPVGELFSEHNSQMKKVMTELAEIRRTLRAQEKKSAG